MAFSPFLPQRLPEAALSRIEPQERFRVKLPNFWTKNTRQYKQLALFSKSAGSQKALRAKAVGEFPMLLLDLVQHMRRPFAQENQAVGQFNRFADIVGDHEDSHAVMCHRLKQADAQFLRGTIVERDKGLVEDEKLTLDGEGACQRSSSCQAE
jgi:hypothetical protein